MQFNQILITLAGFLATAAAVDITICKDQDLGGGCYSASIAVGACWNVPADYNDVVSSYSVGGTCTFFIDGSCTGNSFAGSGTSGTVPSNFNDAISSLRC